MPEAEVGRAGVLDLAAGIDAPEAAARRLSVWSDHAPLEAIWRAAEDRLVTSPYQRFDAIAAWLETIGRHRRAHPAIVVADGPDGAPAFILPLAVERLGPARVARIVGGRHTNFCVPLFDRAYPWTRAAVAALLVETARRADIDAYSLVHVPLEWNGAANPLALLPSRSSANIALRAGLAGDPEATTKALRGASGLRKIRAKDRKMAEIGNVVHAAARTPDDIRRALDTFFPQKSEWLRRQGKPDIFAEPGTRDYFERLTRCGALDLYTLGVGDHIVATFGGIGHQKRFSTCINSYDHQDFARFSPGESLLRYLIEARSAAGDTTFDLGVGEAEYKRYWLHEDEPMRDIFLGVGALGTLTAAGLAASAAARGFVKKTPWAMRALSRLRGRGRTVP
jgi:CelD/BcsL family acetyltransferase involved in cellulose biosynthesis